MMKDMIERYVYDVSRRLPENQREEVKKELFANIGDMLNGSQRESDIEKVLLTLGEPRVLANEYREKKRYLVSPKWMDDYLFVLKIVSIIVVSVSLVFGLIDNITHPEAITAFGMIVEIFSKTVSDMFLGAVQAFAYVTLVFVLIDRVDISDKRKPWTVSKLPSIPKENEVVISRTGSIIGFIFTAIFGSVFLYLLINNSIYLVWLNTGDGWHNTLPLFTDTVVQGFVPLLIVSFVVSLVVHMVKIGYGRLNVPVAYAHTIEKIISSAVFIIFIHASNLINTDFLNQVSTFYHIDVQTITDGFSYGVTILTVILCVGVTIDIIQMWVKTIKNSKLPMITK